MLHGKSDEVLSDGSLARFEGKVNLIFTSPPFPLNRKKRYGNETGESYIRWLCTFGPLFKKMLTPDGSIVIEMGNSWDPGSPVMSTLALRALLEFQSKNDLHLCQEFIWQNPAKLPSPAQWVNVERIRVKDSFTKLWWLSPNEKPKASNQRVLQEYSQSMKDLLKKGSYIVSDSAHIHSGGHDVKSHLEFGYKFAPKDYKPEFKRALIGLGNGVDIDIKAMTGDQQLHAYTVLQQPTKITSFEPHLHAPGTRMCLEAIWGYNIQTLSCVGYDHNWVRGYSYADDVAPILPKGTILHIIGYMDNTPGNKNVPDPRNWSGSGNRSITNMFIDLGNRVYMSDEQFQEEMKARVAANPGKDIILGCPLCGIVAQQMNQAPRQTQNQGQQQ